MIVLAGSLPIEMSDEVRAALDELVAATRREPGCLEYVFGVDLEDPGRVRIFEAWESDEALAAHARSRHVRAWREAAAGAINGPMELTRYDVTSARPFP